MHAPRSEPLDVGSQAPPPRAPVSKEQINLRSCREKGVPSTHVDRLVLCLNEVLANVIVHGKPMQPIALRLEVGSDSHSFEASVTVSDSCRAFDPLSVPKRARPASLDEAPTSGMGLDIIRFCSDVLRYRHEGGRNHLTFGARWKAE